MFEFDAAKSRSNKHKHGLDFVEAQALWDDPRLLEIPARVTGEPRATNIRIISVRRARKEEVALYEKDEN